MRRIYASMITALDHQVGRIKRIQFPLLALVLFAGISYAQLPPECSVHLDEGKRILASAGGKRTWK